MMKKLTPHLSSLLITIIFTAVIFNSTFVVFAADDLPSGAEDTAALTMFANPLGGDGDENISVYTVLTKVIKAVLGLVGVAAFIMFIYGGGLWMTSAGNSERVSKGKETLIWASLGLVVIFGSYALVNFILSAFE